MRSSTASGLLLLATVAAFLVLAGAWWFVCDDAFITFRYARHWAEGHGPVFNVRANPPVEGYSNFLWMAVAALVEKVGLAPADVMPAISLGCGALFLIVAYRSGIDRLGIDPPAALVAAATQAFSAGFVVWATSGLETMPAALLLFLVFHFWVLAEEPGDTPRGGLAAIGLSLIRTEGVLWVLVIAVLAVFRRAVEGERRPVRPIVEALLWVIAAYAVYFAWKYGWYGTVVANTAQAKVEADPDRLSRGVKYLLGFWSEAIAPPFHLLGVLAAWRVARWRGLLVGAMAVGVPLYAVLVGGDFMTMGRLLVPGIAFSALLVGMAVHAAWRWRPAAGGVVAVMAVGLVVLGTLPLADVQLVPDDIRRDFRVRFNTREYRTEAAQWRYMRGNARAWTKLGLALHQVEAPGESIVLGAIGAVGYHSDLYVYDRYGLVSRDVAERDVARVRRASPGHDKVVPVTYFLDREPTYLYADFIPDRAGLRAVVGIAQAWRQPDVRSRYGPVLHEVMVEGEKGYLLVLKRDRDAKALWAGLPGRVDELRSLGRAR